MCGRLESGFPHQSQVSPEDLRACSVPQCCSSRLTPVPSPSAADARLLQSRQVLMSPFYRWSQQEPQQISLGCGLALGRVSHPALTLVEWDRVPSAGMTPRASLALREAPAASHVAGLIRCSGGTWTPGVFAPHRLGPVQRPLYLEVETGFSFLCPPVICQRNFSRSVDNW